MTAFHTLPLLTYAKANIRLFVKDENSLLNLIWIFMI